MKNSSLIPVPVDRIEEAATAALKRIDKSRREAKVKAIRELYRRKNCVYPLLVALAAKWSGIRLAELPDGTDEFLLDWWTSVKHNFADTWDSEASDVWWADIKHGDQRKVAVELQAAARNEPDKTVRFLLSKEDYDDLFS